jgi:hypothetical protein
MHGALVGVVVQAIAGVFGAVAAGTAIRAHSFRIFFNVITGAIGGTAGGLFLHAQIPALINGGGQPNMDASSADDLALRALAGFIAGGLLALIFSVLNLFKDEHINK